MFYYFPHTLWGLLPEYFVLKKTRGILGATTMRGRFFVWAVAGRDFCWNFREATAPATSSVFTCCPRQQNPSRGVGSWFRVWFKIMVTPPCWMVENNIPCYGCNFWVCGNTQFWTNPIWAMNIVWVLGCETQVVHLTYWFIRDHYGQS